VYLLPFGTAAFFAGFAAAFAAGFAAAFAAGFALGAGFFAAGFAAAFAAGFAAAFAAGLLFVAIVLPPLLIFTALIPLFYAYKIFSQEKIS
jgi:hypothetical protein